MADKLPDVANVAAGAMVFGQAFSDRPFSLRVALLGLATWGLFIALAIFFAATEDRP